MVEFYKDKLFCSLALAFVVMVMQARTVSAVQANGINWEGSYHGDALPTASTPAFSIASGATGTHALAAVHHALRIISIKGSAEALSYQINNSALWNGSAYLTVEARVRVAAGGENGAAQSLKLRTGTYDIQLDFRKDRISFRNGPTYFLDATNFRTYRILVRDGRNAELYVDGDANPVLRWAETVTTSESSLRFGDMTAGEYGDVYWEFVRWTSAGAFAPGGDIAWDASYQGNVLPTASTPAFTIASGSAAVQALAVVEAAALRLTSVRGAADALSYQIRSSVLWKGSSDITVEARLQVAAGGANGAAQSLKIRTGTYDIQVDFRKDRVGFLNGGTYLLDARKYRTYRLVIRGGRNTELYVDGIPGPVISYTATTQTTENSLRFGDVTAGEYGDVYWQFIRWTSAGAFVPADYFGTLQVYPTSENGRQWHLPETATNADDEWFPESPSLVISKVGPGVFSASGQVRMSVASPAGKAWWRDVEMTGYVKRTDAGTSGTPHWEFYARGERHTTNPSTKAEINRSVPAPTGTIAWPWYNAMEPRQSLNVACLGTAYHANLYPVFTDQLGRKHSSRAHFEKELDHSNNSGYSANSRDLSVTDILMDQWVGFKFIVRNKVGGGVHLETWLDHAANNTWQRLDSKDDLFGWGVADITKLNGCGNDPYNYARDQILYWAAPWVTFRSDDLSMEFTRFTVRAIDPEQ